MLIMPLVVIAFNGGNTMHKAMGNIFSMGNFIE
jgi:hypothetical protein